MRVREAKNTPQARAGVNNSLIELIPWVEEEAFL